MISAAFAGAFLCVSAAVVDGDTLRCADGTRVRIWGIAAPERREPGGPAATRALAELVGGRTLTCQPVATSFDRIVARCWTLGPDIGAEMVRRGVAKDDPRYSGGAYGSVAP